jgi:hypothetical protein
MNWVACECREPARGAGSLFSAPNGRKTMRYILLWVLGIPIPLLILIYFLFH